MLEHKKHFSLREIDIEDDNLNKNDEQVVENMINLARKFGLDAIKDVQIPKEFRQSPELYKAKMVRDILFGTAFQFVDKSTKRKMGIIINQFDKVFNKEVFQIETGTNYAVAEKDEANQE